MTTFTEADVEQAGLAWLAGLGWRVVHGWKLVSGELGWGVSQESSAGCDNHTEAMRGLRIEEVDDMEVKEAVRVARKYVFDLFSDERVTDIALEEVDFDHDSNAWRITIGFMHPSYGRNAADARIISPWLRPLDRSYKVVHISDETGQVESMSDRFFAPAE